MRLAYLVDIHERFSLVSTNLSRIGELDALVLGGDLTNAGTAEDAERALVEWQASVPRLFAVAGNMDSPAIDTRLRELDISLDQAGVVVEDIGFFGVSAAPVSSLRTPYELDEEELTRRIDVAFEQVVGSSRQIFCPHAPPRGTACDRLRDGQHVGSTAVRAFIEREQPDLVLCGHIHESRGVDRIGKSRIVNPGPASAGHYARIDTDRDFVVCLDGERSPIAFR